MPAQNARPSPVTTTAPTASSSLTRVNRSTSSLAISTVKAFRLAGRDNRKVITRSAIVTARVLYCAYRLMFENAPVVLTPGRAGPPPL
jgi:hypothetical protein